MVEDWKWEALGKSLPIQNPMLSDIRIIRCGSTHALALTNNDELYIIGYHHFSFVSTLIPTLVSIDNTSKIENIYCGEKHFVIGSNTHGQLCLDHGDIPDWTKLPEQKERYFSKPRCFDRAKSARK